MTGQTEAPDVQFHLDDREISGVGSGASQSGYRVHWLARLLVVLPGIGNLARHVPELRRTPGQIALPLFWELLIAGGTLVCILADRRGFRTALLTQWCLVVGAFALVDLCGIHSRHFWLRNVGDDAYRLCFWMLFSPGLMGGFLPAQIHLALVPGAMRAPPALGFLLGVPVLALGLLVAVRVYGSFSADRLFYMYMFYPKEGQLVDTGIFAFLRHPQCASLLYIDLGVVLLQGSVEAVALLIPFLFFGVGRIPPEERELVARFGDAYVRYRMATPALFPRRGECGRFLRFLVAGA